MMHHRQETTERRKKEEEKSKFEGAHVSLSSFALSSPLSSPLPLATSTAFQGILCVQACIIIITSPYLSQFFKGV
jgi:hypothetical protein